MLILGLLIPCGAFIKSALPSYIFVNFVVPSF